MKKIKVKEKGYNKQGSLFTNYIVEGAGITIDTYEDKEVCCNFLNSWSMRIGDKAYTGETVDDLLNTLKAVSLDYGLTTYSENLKDVLVIYTNQLRELYCFLYNYVTDKFLVDTIVDVGVGKTHSIINKGYFQVLDHIEFRKCWDSKDCKTLDQITDWAILMWNDLFEKDKKCYLTENAVTRTTIHRECKKAKCTLGKDIFPYNPYLYNLYKGAAHGGVVTYDSVGDTKDEPIIMIEADLKSAYIFCYTLPMPISAGERIDPNTKTNDLTIGVYKITYKNTSRYLATIKDIYDRNFDLSGELVTQEFFLTSVDLETIKKVAKVKKIECTELYRFDSGLLPKAIIDVLIRFFIDKEKNDKNSGLYKVAKIILNGCYGNAILNMSDYDIKNGKFTDLVPQWGAFITSYCRKIIIDTGLGIYKHRYSDTDCIFCDKTQNNLDCIENWNKQARKHIRELCDLYGYNYEDIKNLGSFIIEEKNIVRMKIVGNKQYAYETAEKGPEDVIVKAAGCVKQDKYSWEDLKEDEMPIGDWEGKFEIIEVPCSNNGRYAETSYWRVHTNDPKKRRAILKVESIMYQLKSVL